MKSITSILLYAIFYLLSVTNVWDYSVSHLANNVTCPDNPERAEELLNEILSKEPLRESVNKDYQMAINTEVLRQIHSVKEGKECKKIKRILNEIGDEREHAYYKVSEHYFIVNYLASRNNEFEFKSVTVMDNKFNILGAIIDFSN